MLKTFQENVNSAKYWSGNGFTLDRDDLVKRHAPFVHAIAREYYHPSTGISFDDLIQEGFTGLLEAAERFKPERGFKFVTYASWWIRKPILKLITEQSQNIKIPAYRWPTIFSARQGFQEQNESEQRRPEKMGSGEPCHLKALDCAQISRGEVSLDEAFGSETPWKDVLRDDKSLDPAAQALRSESLDLLNCALGCLNEREKTVIALRFGLYGSEPMTLQQIGRRLRLSRERVRQIESKALEKLMRHILSGRQPLPAWTRAPGQRP